MSDNQFEIRESADAVVLVFLVSKSKLKKTWMKIIFY